ncbi:hypothetical protein GCM10027155_15660 [Acinetobacter apis]|uniref:Uncharacterized protein n=1 Tax=Acinetobacter apis TaxID=1229165 RepID=A0A217EH67_9GAMM|nr:hypothetical protein [Acinetobacter apis]SNQ29694.1 hypothetical protein SAMN05444584_1658 [Acinetobacter apis]
MKNVIKLFVLSTSFLFMYSALAKNLCFSKETEIMACQLNESKKRNISICYNKEKDQASYRIGTDINNLEMTKEFTKGEPLLRWLDSSNNTIFGFKNSSYFYRITVPEENLGAQSFLTVLDKNKKELMLKICVSNSFGEKKQKTQSVIDVDNKTVEKDINNSIPFPIMFYENKGEKLIAAQKSRISYEKINFINKNLESKCIENTSLNTCKKQTDIKKIVYNRQLALELVPQLISANEHYDKFIFMNLDGDLYAIASNTIDLDSGKTVNYYDFIRLRNDLHIVQLGNWFEVKGKILRYKDIYDNKIKTIKLN